MNNDQYGHEVEDEVEDGKILEEPNQLADQDNQNDDDIDVDVDEEENLELEDVEIPEAQNQWGADQEYIDNIKRHVKDLKDDFDVTFFMVQNQINDMILTRSMANFEDALESLIFLNRRMDLHHLKIKLEMEKQ